MQSFGSAENEEGWRGCLVGMAGPLCGVAEFPELLKTYNEWIFLVDKLYLSKAVFKTLKEETFLEYLFGSRDTWI